MWWNEKDSLKSSIGADKGEENSLTGRLTGYDHSIETLEGAALGGRGASDYSVCQSCRSFRHLSKKSTEWVLP